MCKRLALSSMACVAAGASLGFGIELAMCAGALATVVIMLIWEGQK